MTVTSRARPILDESSPPLWGTWSLVEVVDDVLDVDGLRLHRVGLTAQDADGRVATGSAATLDASARARARFELCERAALIDAIAARPCSLVVHGRDGAPIGVAPFEQVFPSSTAPTLWQPAKSSGVALGPSFSVARDHAELELLERDRVLRSWVGLGPAPVRIEPAPGPWSASELYDWEAYRLPPAATSSASPEVVCVFAFPRDPGRPLLRGFAAARGLDRARERAALECLQNLAFLSDEPIPIEAPAPSPTPLYHLDHDLWPGGHAALRDWLCAGPSDERSAPPLARARSTTRFVDLTPSGTIASFRVVRAIDDGALSLCFGERPVPERWEPTRGPHPVA